MAERMQLMSNLQVPCPRESHFSAPVKKQLCVYGGYGSILREPSTTIQLFSIDSETWKEETTTEGIPPPLNLRMGACTSTGHRVFLQGGWDGEQYYNTLYQLDCGDFKWTQLSSADDQGAPIAKFGHGMVCIQPDCLLTFGGTGPLPTGPTQPGAEYIRPLHLDIVETNELHIFNLREEKWSSPKVTGSRPPPCHNFTLTMVDDYRAVLFGGMFKSRPLDDLYVLDVARKVDELPLWSVSWTKMNYDSPWPYMRYSHAAVCLGFGHHPQLLITGGLRPTLTMDCQPFLNGAWILDLRSLRWRKVKGHNIKPRFNHSATAFTLRQGVTEVIVFGGHGSNFETLSDTTVLRFEWLVQPTRDGPPTKGWVLTDTATGSQLGTEQRVRKKEEIITCADSTLAFTGTDSNKVTRYLDMLNPTELIHLGQKLGICFQETRVMAATWLGSGPPRWAILKNALREIGKEEIATTIENEQETLFMPSTGDLDSRIPGFLDSRRSSENTRFATEQGSLVPPWDIATAITMDLEQTLNANLDAIQNHFDFYVDELLETLELIGISTERFCEFLLDLPAFTNCLEQTNVKCLCDLEKELKHAFTLSAVFFNLKAKFSSFLDYEIFEAIRKNYVVPDEFKNDYPVALKEYVEKHKLEEYVKVCPDLRGLATPTSRIITIEFECEKTCRLDEVKKIKEDVASIMNLSPLVLRIVSVEKGCRVRMSLVIPGAVADVIFTNDKSLTEEQKQGFRKLNILMLKCNDSQLL